ncbi:MAG: hypothetical protein HFI33_10790 [Lachnospiraceae bacterium]|nr:hypothetical protein [Lachnospiraceae bacterium]
MQNRKKEIFKGVDVGFWFCLLLLFAATLVMTKVEMGKEFTDFRTHSRWAVGILVDHKFDKFYFYPLWHFCVRAVYILTPLGREWSAAFVTACFGGATAVLLYLFMRRQLGEKLPVWKCALLTLALLFVTALYMPWFNKELYLGQSSPTIWHNPTNLAVKPLALLIFLCFIRIYQERETIGKRALVLVSFLLLLSCFVKPSFIQGFLPAMVVFLLLELIPSRGRTFWYSLKVALMFIPSGIYFIVQYLLMFDSSGDRKIGIQPFAVMRLDSPNPGISILIGIAFPLFVLVALGAKKVFNDKALWLAVVFYLVSLLEFILLIEETEAASGNFEWAMQLAMFMLFIMTALRFYQTRWKKKWIWIGGNLLFVYHALSGVGYYIWLLVFSSWQC